MVYLDLNHWINLAKASTGHREGKPYRNALRTLQDLAATDEHVFPLSAKHYFEMAAIRDPRQRRDVGEVMANISQFSSLTPPDIVMQMEIDAACAKSLARRIVKRSNFRSSDTGSQVPSGRSVT